MVGNSNGKGWGRRGRVGSGLSVYSKAGRKSWFKNHARRATILQRVFGRSGGKTW